MFRTYRFDWHTGGPGVPKSVEFYIDGKLVASEKNNVPSLASRFWVGAWFPTAWAGEAAFDETELVIDWIRITPFGEAGDRFERETFPCDGWAPSSSCASEPVTSTCSAPPAPPSPSSTTTTTTMTPTTTTTNNSTAPTCKPCGNCENSNDCPSGSWCKDWQFPPTCKGFPDFASFDPQGLCCSNNQRAKRNRARARRRGKNSKNSKNSNKRKKAKTKSKKSKKT